MKDRLGKVRAIKKLAFALVLCVMQNSLLIGAITRYLVATLEEKVMLGVFANDWSKRFIKEIEEELEEQLYVCPDDWHYTLNMAQGSDICIHMKEHYEGCESHQANIPKLDDAPKIIIRFYFGDQAFLSTPERVKMILENLKSASCCGEVIVDNVAVNN